MAATFKYLKKMIVTITKGPRKGTKELRYFYKGDKIPGAAAKAVSKAAGVKSLTKGVGVHTAGLKKAKSLSSKWAKQKGVEGAITLKPFATGGGYSVRAGGKHIGELSSATGNLSLFSTFLK